MKLVEACQADESMLASFDDYVINKADSENPFIVSFLRDEHEVIESLAGNSSYKFFIVRDEKTNQIIARSGINLCPTSDDIYGYGEKAKKMYRTKNMAVLAGDLVDPKYRGQKIQSFMIAERLKWLKSNGYNYAVAGIIENNLPSLTNYESFGFSCLGQKSITWDLKPERTDIVKLYGLDLCD